MPLGISFTPGADQDERLLSGGDPLSSAIQILSLHVPQFLGAQAPVARELLTAPGSAGANQELIRRILQASMGIGGTSSPTGGTGGGTGGGPSEPLPTPPVPRVEYREPPAPDFPGEIHRTEGRPMHPRQPVDNFASLFQPRRDRAPQFEGSPTRVSLPGFPPSDDGLRQGLSLADILEGLAI